MTNTSIHRYRSHTCGELRQEHVGQTVRLSGWVHSARDHGGIIFIDLRDRYGLTQVVIDPKMDFYQSLDRWRVETVISFTGEVVARVPETVNPRLATGSIELVAKEMEILGEAEVLPFQIAKEENCPEALRLKYRFLDLRREKLRDNILLRAQVISEIRASMTGMGFTEFQTPILTCSSPEGARDYLVPSRIHPGKFYALPQAPQQFKQLLMVSGFDRYFQIAPCFRDEDARADRSPGEFYQLDIEMSFVTQEDIFAALEKLLIHIFQKFSKKTVSSDPFVRIPYKEAMDSFGCDKPDLRNPLRIIDVSETFRGCGFNAFAGAVEKGGVVRAITVKGISGKPRSFFDDMVGFAQSLGAKGMAYISYVGGTEKSPIAKFLNRAELDAVKVATGAQEGDVVFFLADTVENVRSVGGQVRTELGKRLELIDKSCHKFCWVVDFPMFEKDPETGETVFSHNPFSMPQGGMEALLEKNPLDILAYQYDIVCNGIELSSGAIRNHRPDIMYRAFEIAGYSKDEVNSRFGHMIDAFKLGAPPHGGIAPGLDRLVMILRDEQNIREVIAFPMNQSAQDLMMSAPSEVMEQQLKELCLKIELPPAKEEKK